MCIPAPGIQITNISHVRDLSSMLTLAAGKPEAANGSIFNAVSDRGTTFDGLVRMCAKAAGKEANIVHYDPKAAGVDAKKAFPFRNMVRLPFLTFPSQSWFHSNGDLNGGFWSWLCAAFLR